jgi:putative transposase
MKKSFQFRIYPNKNQEVTLNRTLSTCRHLYNDSLAERKREFELNKLKQDFGVFPWGKPEWINYYDQAGKLTATKTYIQKEVFSQVLQNVLKRIDRSFKNFFKGSGYPRFQGRNRYNTFTYPQSGFGLEDGKLNLSKIGTIKIIQHRDIEGKIKTCTIKKDIDQWYVIFSCELNETMPEEIKQSRDRYWIKIIANIKQWNSNRATRVPARIRKEVDPNTETIKSEEEGFKQ